MEARLQYSNLMHDSPVMYPCFEPYLGMGLEPVPTFPDEDVQMDLHPPVEEPPVKIPKNYLFRTHHPSVHPRQTSLNLKRLRAKIEFSTQWNNRKEAVWDILAPKRGVQSFISSFAPKAHAAPRIWAENIYDAQDVLPYFTVGQTILTSKVPRPVARSVLLTKNLHEIRVDWRSGKIEFTVQVRYKLQLNRPKNWQTPSPPCKVVNPNCKPMDPIQFRKLRACYEGGIPVRVLATGDFPFLPTFQPESQEGLQPVHSISSSNWQNGVVMLGFFWVKKIAELGHWSEKEDLETGKCSGQSKWAFEFLSCDLKGRKDQEDHKASLLPWWYPAGDDDTQDDDESELENVSKRRRVDLDTNSQLCGDVSMSDAAEQGEIDGESANKTAPNGPRVKPPCVNPVFRNMGSVSDGIHSHTQINAHLNAADPPEIRPGELGLKLEPIVGTNECLSRAPKLRASLLLGWLCQTCGRLNPRKKWAKDQTCPLCQTTSTLTLPEWDRRAHTEAAGPIGTLFRLDDGGHQPKTGLHQMTVRDEETGLTFVEYWLAEAPMPIIAELNRVSPANRRKTRRKLAPLKRLEAPQPNITSSTDTSTSVPSTLVPVSQSNNTQAISPVPALKDGIHPDGGKLIRQRDPGGSRAVFSDNTRMLFMHITCPQHPSGLALVDQIFSGFATDVQMERQENNANYRTGASALSCHYTYLAGCGTHIMHTSSPAVGWEDVPTCVYDAHALLVDYQTHTVFDDNKTILEFNQSIFIMGNGATGTSTFRACCPYFPLKILAYATISQTTHRAEEGPVGYIVFGASCSIEVLVGNGDNKKRTTKGGAARRAEMLLAHGDALMTMPMKGDAPLEVRVKRTGLAVVLIARYVPPESIQVKPIEMAPQKGRLSVPKQMPTVTKSEIPTKRKARTPSAKYPQI
ncbi:hypothetical protein OPQ81_008650 [Rhizoctonia solani]|nr:hypothetical protein OPQ81_008650 [Rhizoctonia solani]